MRGLKLLILSLIISVISRIFYRCVDWNHHSRSTHNRASESHLLQMRGLKRDYIVPATGACVASFTDAWIETKTEKLDGRQDTSRIFYRCVDWNQISFSDNDGGHGSHLLQMRGLKRERGYSKFHPFGRIFYRCVDWNRQGTTRENNQ